MYQRACVKAVYAPYLISVGFLKAALAIENGHSSVKQLMLGSQAVRSCLCRNSAELGVPQAAQSKRGHFWAAEMTLSVSYALIPGYFPHQNLSLQHQQSGSHLSGYPERQLEPCFDYFKGSALYLFSSDRLQPRWEADSSLRDFQLFDLIAMECNLYIWLHAG